MKYFLPYWEDWVHKDFDPISESYSEANLFAHEIFEKAPYDGILVSLGLFKLKLKLIKENGRPKIRNSYNIRSYLRLSEELEVMGDCGAFTYINEKAPLISPEEAVYYYESLGFDYGISVDHICSDFVIVEEKDKGKFSYIEEESKGKLVKLILSDKEKEYRRQISIKNAEKFLKLSKNKNFIPIGAVQGYSIETYLDSAIKLVNQGYTYLAIGGLVPKSTEFISELLDQIYKQIDTAKIKIHLLGVLREGLIEKMSQYQINSFDSASYYRKAWLEEDKNYLGVDNKWYSAIRVVQSDNPRYRKKLDRRIINKIQSLENRILFLLRKYDNSELKDVDSLIEEIINYDKFFLRDSFKEEKYFKLYKELLTSEIWKECDCPMCRSMGIDVVIFRGADRNKRRGFHNTYIFYKKLENIIKSVPSISVPLYF